MVPPRLNSPDPQLLVVTDLDGTLLDHHDYGFAAVLPVLKRLAELGVPVVANTSKTRQEWLAMRGDFGNDAAFVVENGSATYLPDGTSELSGASRDEILEALGRMSENYRFQGFQELGLQGVIDATGLSAESAHLAMSREYSEPLLWQDSPEKEDAFCAEVEGLGFQTLRGGRFLHVLGQTDKGRPLAGLRKYYQTDRVVALGDSPNDVAMLAQAEIAVVIPSAGRTPLEVPGAKRLIHSRQHGPEGWAEVMNQLIKEFYPPSKPNV